MLNLFKIILNPQALFEEKKLLLLGIISLIIGCFIGDITNSSFDGVFDVHLTESREFIDSLIENTINIVCVFILLCGFGKIINSNTRWIDILNTSLLYRIPIYCVVPFTNFPVFTRLAKMDIENSSQNFIPNFSISEIIQLSVASLFMILLLVYSIVLLSNGFKTATNTKKWQHFVIFGGLLLLAEVISKIILSQL